MAWLVLTKWKKISISDLNLDMTKIMPQLVSKWSCFQRVYVSMNLSSVNGHGRRRPTVAQNKVLSQLRWISWKIQFLKIAPLEAIWIPLSIRPLWMAAGKGDFLPHEGCHPHFVICACHRRISILRYGIGACHRQMSVLRFICACHRQIFPSYFKLYSSFWSRLI